MKAIILAAGKGVRMGKYTQDVPKGMLSVNGKTLIEWQMQALRRGGVESIVIGTGYQRETIPYEDVIYYHNPDFATTNMVETLMCARPELDCDIIISYADIVYTAALVEQLAATEAPVAVAVDAAWREYWTLRFGSAEEDLETLTVRDGRIVELGKEVSSSEGIDHRYIGLIKFSKEAWHDVLALYDAKKAEGAAWKQSGKDFRNGYMTDLLNELIENDLPVVPCVSEKQWMEFDTEQDYETAMKHLKNHKIADVFTFDA